VHDATGLAVQVERLRRAVDHAEVELPVGDDRLDRAEARVSVTADRAEEDQAAGVEAPPSLAGQLGGLGRELPPMSSWRHRRTGAAPMRKPLGSSTADMSSITVINGSLTARPAERGRTGSGHGGCGPPAAAGDDVTFAKVATEAAVAGAHGLPPLPTREALLTAVYVWANQRIGFDGHLPTSGAEATALVRRVFPGFDEIAPVTASCSSPRGPAGPPVVGGGAATVALAMVDGEVPGSTRRPRRRLAAALQLMTTAGTWLTLRDYWGMDGEEAGETAALAVEPPRAGRPRPPPSPTHRPPVKELLVSPIAGTATSLFSPRTSIASSTSTPPSSRPRSSSPRRHRAFATPSSAPGRTRGCTRPK
jgi:hypothetical protein